MSVESKIVVPSPVLSKENLFWNTYLLVICFYFIYKYVYMGMSMCEQMVVSADTCGGQKSPCSSLDLEY